MEFCEFLGRSDQRCTGVLDASCDHKSPVHLCGLSDFKLSSRELEQSRVLRAVHVQAFTYCFLLTPSPVLSILDFYILAPLSAAISSEYKSTDFTLRERLGGGNYGITYEAVRKRSTPRPICTCPHLGFIHSPGFMFSLESPLERRWPYDYLSHLCLVGHMLPRCFCFLVCAI